MSEQAWVLADVDAMYCSCERVFDPRLRGVPLAVLANNDGCVIARSAEAAALGISTGQPWRQVRGRPGLAVRSASYPLQLCLFGGEPGLGAGRLEHGKN